MPLSKGYFTLIDADNQHLFDGKKWSASEVGRKPRKAYAKARFAVARGVWKTRSLHCAVLPPPPGLVIDHINGDTLDNRRENLRVCTQAENVRNRRNKGTKGISRVKLAGGRIRWRAYLCKTDELGKKRFMSLGYFDTQREAAIAYNLAAAQHFGSFACFNEV